MHPVLRSASALGAYMLAWIPFAALYGYLFAADRQISLQESAAITAPTVLVLSLVCLAPWPICQTLPLGSSPTWRLLAGHLVPAMFFSGMVLAANHGIVLGWNHIFPGLAARFRALVPVLAVMSFFTYFLSVALHYAFQAVEQSKRAELLSREAQLKALKAQVNPHFLFNSLNSISALTAVDASRARSMCVRLSDFLRTSLRLGERPSVNFAEEWALARNYLEVEQVRFGNRLSIRDEIEPDCSACEVPPLLLQPIVENAIKHGVATLVDGGEIVVRAFSANGSLHVSVENDYDPDAPSTVKSGFGLANVRSRLEARYGAAGKLEVHVAHNRFCVRIEAPCLGQRSAS